MGEAKKRQARMAAGPCRCGSSRAASSCCYTGKDWHKAPAVLGLHALEPKSSLDKCYMKELGSCDGGLSGEHLISEAIILLLKARGDFTVSGFPWQDQGEVKVVGSKSLTAKCLCRKHNSALSPLDDAALFFFAAIKSCLEREVQSMDYLVSGHDIERWLLKTVRAMAASRNLSQGGERLSGAFASDVEVLDMLDDPRRWPENAGLYCVMATGETTENNLRFQLHPFVNSLGEISGIGVNILGLQFVLMLERLDLAQNPQLQQAKFRPGRIAIKTPMSICEISLSWEDGNRHDETLSLQFLREVPRPTSA